MDFKIRKIGGAVLAAALVATFVITGCGGGGGSSAGGGTPTPTSSNLKGALYSVMSTVPVVTNSLQRQTSTGIANATVSYVTDTTGIAGFNTAKITVAGALTDVNGTASMAVPAGNYTAKLSGLPLDLVTGENAPYYATETVNASGTKTYTADQYTVNITASVPLATVDVTVYQTDSAGNVDYGSYTKAVNPITGAVGAATRNPIVFAKTAAVAGGATTATENIELFKGYYRIVVRATAVTATNVLAPDISSVITVAGGGLTSSHNVTMVAPSKVPTITLNDTTGAAITTGYTVQFYEKTNRILLGTAVTDAAGTASVGAAAGTTGVVAKILAPTTLAYSGVYVFNDINSSASAILNQYTVTGQLQPTANTLDPVAIPTVYALANTGLGRWIDTQVASTTAAAGTGVYTLTLFGNTAGLSYKLSANNVTNFPDVTKLTVSVNGALTAQNIAVAPGAVILGKLQTEGKVDLNGYTVEVYGTSADGIIDLVASAVTATGNYSIQVPYGTYFLMVNGAVTEGITVSAGTPTATKNLTEFALTGQVSKNLGTTTAGASGATVYAGTLTATTGGLGTYSIKVMEGKNWICAAPSATDATYGYTCVLNVLVDATSVAAARQ